MKVKVCGMRDDANINDVIALGVDLIGLIFYPKSSRYVLASNPPTASFKKPEGKPDFVGVFVNEPYSVILENVQRFNLDYVQLHGDETPDYINTLRQQLATTCSHPIRIVKAMSVSSAADVSNAKRYDGYADYMLFDSKCTGRGGSGTQFDWTVLEQYTGETPFFLSGGIGPDDADNILRISHPKLCGIDLNSRFETSPALKNVEMLGEFIHKFRKTRI